MARFTLSISISPPESEVFTRLCGSARPYHRHCCRPNPSDPEMQRTASLRGVLAAAAAIILAEPGPTPIIHRDARADSIPVRLHSLQVHFKEVILIAVVLKEIMESLRGVTRERRRANSVLEHEIEKSVVVIVPPSRYLMRRSW